MITKETAKTTINDVMASDSFGIEIETYWQEIKKVKEPKVKNDLDLDWLEALSHFFSDFGQVLIWFFAGLLVGFLIFQLIKNKQWLKQFLKPKKTKRKPPSELFGLAIDKQSLPEHISDTALALLAEGKLREALSLLYRGALARFVYEQHIEITDNLTETECAELIQQKAPNNESQLFNSLTQTWLLFAYGHQSLETQKVADLCQQWRGFYESESVEEQ